MAFEFKPLSEIRTLREAQIMLYSVLASYERWDFLMQLYKKGTITNTRPLESLALYRVYAPLTDYKLVKKYPPTTYELTRFGKHFVEKVMLPLQNNLIDNWRQGINGYVIGLHGETLFFYLGIGHTRLGFMERISDNFKKHELNPFPFEDFTKLFPQLVLVKPMYSINKRKFTLLETLKDGGIIQNYEPPNINPKVLKYYQLSKKGSLLVKSEHGSYSIKYREPDYYLGQLSKDLPNTMKRISPGDMCTLRLLMEYWPISSKKLTKEYVFSLKKILDKDHPQLWGWCKNYSVPVHELAIRKFQHIGFVEHLKTTYVTQEKGKKYYALLKKINQKGLQGTMSRMALLNLLHKKPKIITLYLDFISQLKSHNFFESSNENLGSGCRNLLWVLNKVVIAQNNGKPLYTNELMTDFGKALPQLLTSVHRLENAGIITKKIDKNISSLKLLYATQEGIKIWKSLQKVLKALKVDLDTFFEKYFLTKQSDVVTKNEIAYLLFLLSNNRTPWKLANKKDSWQRYRLDKWILESGLVVKERGFYVTSKGRSFYYDVYLPSLRAWGYPRISFVNKKESENELTFAEKIILALAKEPHGLGKFEIARKTGIIAPSSRGGGYLSPQGRVVLNRLHSLGIVETFKATIQYGENVKYFSQSVDNFLEVSKEWYNDVVKASIKKRNLLFWSQEKSLKSAKLELLQLFGIELGIPPDATFNEITRDLFVKNNLKEVLDKVFDGNVQHAIESYWDLQKKTQQIIDVIIVLLDSVSKYLSIGRHWVPDQFTFGANSISLLRKLQKLRRRWSVDVSVDRKEELKDLSKDEILSHNVNVVLNFVKVLDKWAEADFEWDAVTVDPKLQDALVRIHAYYNTLYPEKGFGRVKYLKRAALRCKYVLSLPFKS